MKLCLKQMEIDIKMVPNYRESEYFKQHLLRKQSLDDLQAKINNKHLFGTK